MNAESLAPSNNLEVLEQQLKSTLTSTFSLWSGGLICGTPGVYRAYLMQAIEIALIAFMQGKLEKLRKLNTMLGRLQGIIDIPETTLWELLTVARTVAKCINLLEKQTELMRILNLTYVRPILQYLEKTGDSRTADEASHALGISKETVSRLLDSLEDSTPWVLRGPAPNEAEGQPVMQYSLSETGRRVARLSNVL